MGRRQRGYRVATALRRHRDRQAEYCRTPLDDGGPRWETALDRLLTARFRLGMALLVDPVRRRRTPLAKRQKRRSLRRDHGRWWLA